MAQPSSSSSSSSSSGSEVLLALLDPAKEAAALRRTLQLDPRPGQAAAAPVNLSRLRASSLLVSTPRSLLTGGRDRGRDGGRSGGGLEEFQVVYVCTGIAARGSSEWEAAKRILSDRWHAPIGR